MNIERTLTGLFLTACCLLSGCAALSSDGTTLSKAATRHSGQPETSPIFRAQNHRQWVMRLKIAKPIEGLDGRAATQGATTSLPIPLPPTSLEQYALVVDQHQQIAWLQGSQNYGPFPLTNPDVTHLMNSVAAAYQEQAAWQASMQQASVPPGFQTGQQTGQQAGMTSFSGLPPQQNQSQPEWNSPSQQQTEQSSYASEFDNL